MVAVRIENVTKRYGQHVAVNDLSLEVPEGSVYGFIGPNGSGKTTTLRMILHVILPTEGKIEVLGQSGERSANDRIGYLPEERGLYPKMKVRNILRYYGALKGKSRAQCDPVIDEWLERFELTQWADKPVQTLSKGMAQKVQFISTVVAKPELIILDEPFSGLDPVNAEVLIEAVLELNRQGSTIIFSTHDMSTAEKLCDVIFMIYKGNKVLDAPLDQIQDRYGSDMIRLRCDASLDVIRALPGVTDVRDFGKMQELRIDGDPQDVLRALAPQAAIQQFEVTRPSLHDIFVRIARPAKEDIQA